MLDATVPPRPLVLVHCEWTRDRELIQQLLDELGCESLGIENSDQAMTILHDDRVDLILADSSGGIDPIRTLLRLLDDRAEGSDLPIVFLANAADLPLLSELTMRRFNAVLLTKPMSHDQLCAAVESGLRFRARQREVRLLLSQLSASNEQLASANEALELRREESAEEARRKTRFLAAISHDIRTPVNALVLSCQLLRMIGQTSPNGTIEARDIDELTGALLSNASALVELVNDLLDIARHDQGKLEFVESDFPVGDFLTATTEGLRPLADQKGLKLTVDVAHPDVVVRTDRVKFARVVQNLVANAIKFTEVGHVRVTIEATLATGLRLEVEDTGIGIPAGMSEGIFDEFAQLRNPERDRTKGTGLGLAICRRLVVAMGGTIAVDPAARAVGSRFVVTLPASRIAADSLPRESPGEVEVPPSAPPRRGDVLVVEDHEPSRLLLQRLLRSAGLSVRTAENGQEALRAIDQSLPDLVLMDLMMPVLGGREALHILRTQAGTRDLNVIILTGDLNQQDASQMFGEANAYLSKPVEITMLHALLDRFIPGPINAG